MKKCGSRSESPCNKFSQDITLKIQIIFPGKAPSANTRLNYN